MQRLFQPLVSVRVLVFNLIGVCYAQIPNSDVGNYPSGVLTLVTAMWCFFGNSTSTLYGMVPQYWLMPGLQTTKNQRRDDRKRVKCCQFDCYNLDTSSVCKDATNLFEEFKNQNVDLKSPSMDIVNGGSWSFAALVEESEDALRRGSDLFLESQSRDSQLWLEEFKQWVKDVNGIGSTFWIQHLPGDGPQEVLSAGVTVRTVDAITNRVGSRRRTMTLKNVRCLLTHYVAAAAARWRGRCVVYETMFVSFWANGGFSPPPPAQSSESLVTKSQAEATTTQDKGPNAKGDAKPPWPKPVIVSASTLRLRALTPPPGLIIPFEPSETHALWLYIILITCARVSISSATALGSSGSLWFAVFTGLYLTNSSAAISFGRDEEDPRANSGFMSGAGFYLNFSRSTRTRQQKFYDSLESISVLISLIFCVVIRLYKLKLRYLLGYGSWVPSAPWQMAPGVVLSFWAGAIYAGELVGNIQAFMSQKKEAKADNTWTWKRRLFAPYKFAVLISCFACVGLGGASIITAYQGAPAATRLRWMTYGVAEIHSWHVGFYQFGMDKVDGPDMWFAASSTLAAMWGATLLAVASDVGDSLI